MTTNSIEARTIKVSSDLKPKPQSELFYPIMIKKMTDDEIKKYHLKKLAEWGKKWEQEQKAELVFGVDGKIYRNDRVLAEEPNYRQKEWILRRLKAPSWTWRRCC